MSQVKEMVEIFAQFGAAGPMMKLVLVAAAWLVVTKIFQTLIFCGKWWLLSGARIYLYVTEFKKQKHESGLSFVKYTKNELSAFIKKELGLAEKQEQKPVQTN